MIYSKQDLLNLYDDADFYDAEFGDRDFEINFYKAICKQQNRILEVACGTGRITIPLAKAGFSVTGTDISESMIAKAKKNAKEANASVEFSTVDARNTSGSFDLIFIATNAFQHFLSYKDALDFLIACRRSLSVNGSLVVDLQIPNVEKLSRKEEEVRHYKAFTYHDNEIAAHLCGSYHKLSQIYQFSIKYFDDDKLIKRKDVAMRMYFPQELNLLFEVAGFDISKEYGNYDFATLDPTSDKQIYLLTKSNMPIKQEIIEGLQAL